MTVHVLVFPFVLFPRQAQPQVGCVTVWGLTRYQVLSAFPLRLGPLWLRLVFGFSVVSQCLRNSPSTLQASTSEDFAWNKPCLLWFARRCPRSTPLSFGLQGSWKVFGCYTRMWLLAFSSGRASLTILNHHLLVKWSLDSPTTWRFPTECWLCKEWCNSGIVLAGLIG